MSADVTTGLSLRMLRYFLAAAEEANLVAASRVLNVAQPALTRQIQSLERRVATRLFDRTSRGVRLTPAGERMVEHSRAVLEAVQVLVDDMKWADSPAEQPVRVALSVAALDVPAMRSILERIRDGGSLRFASIGSDAQVQEIIAGRQDIGFLFMEEDDPRLRVEGIADYAWCVAMHANHPLAHKRELTLDDLRGHQFIETGYRDERLDACLLAHGFHPAAAQRTQNVRVLQQLVTSGIGLAFANTAWGSGVIPGLVVRPVRELAIPLRFKVACRRDEHRAEVLEVMAAAVEIAQSCDRGAKRHNTASARARRARAANPTARIAPPNRRKAETS
jgi:LysR family transcriptional regulator, benzoate and cis,cis-muconate-responsive activator of ben and cat genes